MNLSKEIPEIKTLMTGLAFGESPRWHKNRLWFSNWAAKEAFGFRYCPVWKPFGPAGVG
jgi:hypothetical protein